MDHDLKAALRREPVIDLSPTPALTIQSGATVAQALEIMREKRAGCIIVVDDAGKAAGVFTERDLIKRVLKPQKPLSTPLASVMTAAPRTLTPTDSAAHALKQFHHGRARHLPVVDEEGKPTGVISVKRLIHYLAESCPEAVYNIPPNPERISTELYSG
jgi:CBS domain-containing protein